MLTVIIGGSGSGKSKYAEKTVSTFSGKRIYLATMEPFDAECRARILRHREQRLSLGMETVERFTDIAGLDIPGDSCVLLEDLSNLLANEMYSPAGGGIDSVRRGLEAVERSCAHLIIVTNEIFSGGDRYEGDTLSFMRNLAVLNRELADRADSVTEVVCGRPVMLKKKSEDRVVDETGRNDKNGRKKMIFVTGPLFSGKQMYIQKALGLSDREFRACSVRDVQDMASGADPEILADQLAENRIVIATEIGGGVVPADPAEREKREAAGRLACLLAERADTVIRVCCGLPQVLKGNL